MLKKIISSVVVSIPFILSTNMAVASSTSSEFMIRLFNNTSLKQPLRYVIKSDKHDPVEGQLLVGDDHGQTIKVGEGSTDKATVEIVVTDSTGHRIWDNSVSFYEKTAEFYAKTISLDANYSVSSNAFPNIKSITFDIRGIS